MEDLYAEIEAERARLSRLHPAQLWIRRITKLAARAADVRFAEPDLHRALLVEIAALAVSGIAEYDRPRHVDDPPGSAAGVPSQAGALGAVPATNITQGDINHDHRARPRPFRHLHTHEHPDGYDGGAASYHTHTDTYDHHPP